MRTVMSLIVLVGAMTANAAISQESKKQEPKKSTADLARIIGTWSFEDASADGSGSYRETGTRTCAYALNETYIRCESIGKNKSGKERTYLFYFNYNSVDARYELQSLHSDWSQSQKFTITIAPDGSWNVLREGARSADGVLRKSVWGKIRFPDAESLVWEIHLKGADEAPDRWVLSYVDRSKRIRP